MNNPRLTWLFRRAMTNLATLKERDELFSLIADRKNDEQIKKLFEEEWGGFSSGNVVFSEEKGVEMLRRILHGQPTLVNPKRVVRFSVHQRRRKLAAACILIVFSAIGLYFAKGLWRQSPPPLDHAGQLDLIRPGGNKAVLTLPDGRHIDLSDEKEEIVIRENGMVYGDNSEIVGLDDVPVRRPGHVSSKSATFYHSVSTPKGGQYRVVLPDGTRVFLNSMSSLRYPSVFDEQKREVELQGEGYFEVAQLSVQDGEGKPTKTPFIVNTQHQVIEVLGTTFNVNTYGDRNRIKTTLLEGRVKVSLRQKVETNLPNATNYIILDPGKEAVYRLGANTLEVADADIEQATGWCKGYFVFNNENIVGIMEKVARWYDIDVVYEGDMSGKNFGGIFQRSKSIDQLIRNLELTGKIRFKIQAKKIIVTAN